MTTLQYSQSVSNSQGYPLVPEPLPEDDPLEDSELPDPLELPELLEDGGKQQQSPGPSTRLPPRVYIAPSPSHSISLSL